MSRGDAIKCGLFRLKASRAQHARNYFSVDERSEFGRAMYGTGHNCVLRHDIKRGLGRVPQRRPDVSSGRCLWRTECKAQGFPCTARMHAVRR